MHAETSLVENNLKEREKWAGYVITRSRHSPLPSSQLAPRASQITMLVLCPNLLSDKIGFCLLSPDASASASAKCQRLRA